MRWHWCRRRRLSPPPLRNTARAMQVAKAVVKSLADPAGWGVRRGELLSTATQLAGRWEVRGSTVAAQDQRTRAHKQARRRAPTPMTPSSAPRLQVGADAGLATLAAAVERERAASTGMAEVTVRVFPPSGERPSAQSARAPDSARGHGSGRRLRLWRLATVEAACAPRVRCIPTVAPSGGGLLIALVAPPRPLLKRHEHLKRRTATLRPFEVRGLEGRSLRDVVAHPDGDGLG